MSNDLPVTTLATDQVTFPVGGFDGGGDESAVADRSRLAALERLRHRPLPQGQHRLFKGELRQAEQAFLEVERSVGPTGR